MRSRLTAERHSLWRDQRRRLALHHQHRLRRRNTGSRSSGCIERGSDVRSLRAGFSTRHRNPLRRHELGLPEFRQQPGHHKSRNWSGDGDRSIGRQPSLHRYRIRTGWDAVWLADRFRRKNRQRCHHQSNHRRGHLARKLAEQSRHPMGRSCGKFERRHLCSGQWPCRRSLRPARL